MVVYCDVCIINCNNWESSTMNFNAERECNGCSEGVANERKKKSFQRGKSLDCESVIVLCCIASQRIEEKKMKERKKNCLSQNRKSDSTLTETWLIFSSPHLLLTSFSWLKLGHCMTSLSCLFTNIPYYYSQTKE